LEAKVVEDEGGGEGGRKREGQGRDKRVEKRG
jgi:hypothetical protein